MTINWQHAGIQLPRWKGFPFIKQRHVRACHNADPEYGRMLAETLNIDLAEALTAEDPAHPSWDKRDIRK